MSTCLLQENGTESDCSSYYESIHPAFTITQSCIAVAIIVIGVPLNLLLIVALIKFRHLVDEGFMLCLSIFVANLILSIAFGTDIFVASSTRSWPLGYRACQFFGFVTYFVGTVRWMTLGMLSIDRFCRVFLPFRYARHSKTVLKVLFLLPWVILLPTAILPLSNINGTYDFYPGPIACYYSSRCTEYVVCPITIYLPFTVVLASGSVLPIALYTILYCKGRRLRRAMRSQYAYTEQQQMEDNERQNKATKTFALMVITFSCYSSVVILIQLVAITPVIKDIAGLYFLMTDILFLYLITDFFLVWKNTDGKKVIKKFINTVLHKRVSTSDTTIPPSSTVGQQLSSVATRSVD